MPTRKMPTHMYGPARGGVQRAALMVVVVLLTLFVAGCEGYPKQPGVLDWLTGSQADALILVSFNIRYDNPGDGQNAWVHRRAGVVEILRRQAPDIAGLQEALRHQVDQIQDDLPSMAWVGVGRDDGQDSGEFVPIFYRRDRFELVESGTFWLSETPTRPGSRTWGNTLPRICTWAVLRDRRVGRMIRVYNTHLDHQSQESRERSAALIAADIQSRVQPGDSVILLGDLNAGERSRVLRFLTGKLASPLEERLPDPAGWAGLVDTFRYVEPDAAFAGTFNAWRTGPEAERGDKIDYVLVDPSLTPVRAFIDRSRPGGRHASDHWAVVATVRYASGARR
jgi:endonuclease/exonuclease/phosphatase family metal-dependent hydrolase